jgi:hypothetical protein
MKKIIYFIILLVLLVSCESKREIIINRKKSGIIADGQQINMLYTEPSEYIKLINDNPLFAVCMFDSKTDYADDYIAVFNNLTPLLEEEYGFVPEVAVDFGGNTIFTQEKHTYYDWGDGISVNQTYYLDNYFYHIYDEYILSAYESVFTIRSFEETVEIPQDKNDDIILSGNMLFEFSDGYEEINNETDETTDDSLNKPVYKGKPVSDFYSTAFVPADEYQEENHIEEDTPKKSKKFLNIPILIIAILLFVLIAVLVYCIFYIPASNGVSPTAYLQDTFNTLFG